MANISKEERQRRELDKSRGQHEKEMIDPGGDDQAAQRRQQAKLGNEFGGTAYVEIDEELRRRNEIDERLEDRRPGTLADRETGEAFEDNRKFAGDLGKASNQMIGRAFITENADIHPHITHPEIAAMAGPVFPNVQDPAQAQADGEEVVLLRGIMKDEFTKHQPGTVLRMPRAQAKQLVNVGAAKFTEENDG